MQSAHAQETGMPAFAANAQKGRTVEVTVFLLLIVPSLILSLFVVRQGHLSFVLTALSVIARDVGLVALVLYFLWRNGEPVKSIGWKPRHAPREIGLGLLLFVPFFFLTNFVEQLLSGLGFSGPAPGAMSMLVPHGSGQLILGAVLVTIVAVSEETIFRGYLILRLATATRSIGMAVVLSTIIFGMGHGYEGAAGLVTVTVMGLIFALVYLWRGSLLAPITLHFLQDFLGIVVLPLIAGHP